MQYLPCSAKGRWISTWKGSLMEIARLSNVSNINKKPLIALLRRAWLRLIMHGDNMLLMDQSTAALQNNMATLLYLLENLGFVVNKA